MTEKTLYDRLGGEAAVAAAVDVFYQRVLADDRINYFFQKMDMRKQAAKQRLFLTLAFGGPAHYNGRSMREAHAHLGLTEMHFNAVMEHLGATLRELKVPEDMILECAMIAASTKDDVLNR